MIGVYQAAHHYLDLVSQSRYGEAVDRGAEGDGEMVKRKRKTAQQLKGSRNASLKPLADWMYRSRAE
jgi:hypothetical protein